jgi:hypothetical protein
VVADITLVCQEDFSLMDIRNLLIGAKVDLADVAGCDGAKWEHVETVDFLKNTSHYSYTELDAKMPKGARLVGSSGSGKTMMAKPMAGKAGGTPSFGASAPYRLTPAPAHPGCGTSFISLTPWTGSAARASAWATMSARRW